MKRSEALRSLSRDHHQALVVAQHLRRAAHASEGARVFLEYWTDHGEAHFRIEEEVLLPLWGLLGTVDEPAAARLSAEHLRIRSGALALQSAKPSIAQVRDLGEQLAAHVRFEERELFRLIEEDLPAASLDRLARAVSAAEEQR